MCRNKELVVNPMYENDVQSLAEIILGKKFSKYYMENKTDQDTAASVIIKYVKANCPTETSTRELNEIITQFNQIDDESYKLQIISDMLVFGVLAFQPSEEKEYEVHFQFSVFNLVEKLRKRISMLNKNNKK